MAAPVRNDTHDTDTGLIARARNGDHEAAGRLWQRHEDAVLSFCRRYLSGSLHDPAVDAHDLANEVFIRAIHFLDQYQDRSLEGIGFRPWLLEITRGICLNSLARWRRRSQWHAAAPAEALDRQADRTAEVQRQVQERAVLRQVSEAVNWLPEPYRTPFKLYLQEFSHREIAASLGISIEGARKRIDRARRLLQPRVVALFDTPTGIPARELVRAAERALSGVVTECRSVAIRTASGAELVICLRVNRQLAGRAAEIETLRGAGRGQTRWRQRLELAELCYHSGEWDAAIEEYRGVVALRPECVEAVLRLGGMLEAQDQTEEARPVYHAALDRLAGGAAAAARAARLEGRLRALEGDSERAAAAYRRALELDPREKGTYRDLGRVLGRHSRHEEQLETLRALLQLDPYDLEAMAGTYLPCAALGRWDEALRHLERAHTLDPSDYLCLFHLFQVRMNIAAQRADPQELERAFPLAEHLVHLAPSLSSAWDSFAWVCCELGRPEEGIQALCQFLQDHPNDPEGHANLCWRGRTVLPEIELFAHARRAYELAPGSWFICWTFLVAALGLPEAGAAAERAVVADLLGSILDRHPNHFQVLTAAAHVCRKWGQPERGLHLARRAMALAPDTEEAQTELARTLASLGRWNELIAEFAARFAQPEDLPSNCLVLYGKALRHTRHAQADALLETALGRAAQRQDDLLEARLYAAWGREEEARVACVRGLRVSPLAPHRRAWLEHVLTSLTEAE